MGRAKFLIDFFGKLSPVRITPEKIEEYIDKRLNTVNRRKTLNKPATVTKKLKQIKAIFQTAVKRRQLDENPLRYIMMPKCPKSEIHIYNQGRTRYSFGLYQWSEFQAGVAARWQWHFNIYF